MFECCYCQKSGVLNDHLVVLYHIKESNDQLIIVDRDDVIQILLDVREDVLARCLYCSTVCNGIYIEEESTTSPFSMEACHAGSSGRLYTDDFDLADSEAWQEWKHLLPVRLLRLEPGYNLPAAAPERSPWRWFPDLLQQPDHRMDG